MNLKVYNAVREVPKEAKKPITGGRLAGMTDINPMWRIKTLTEQFGMCGVGWYYRVTDSKTIPFPEDNPKEVIAHVEIALYVKDGNEWSQPIHGVGGSKVVSMERGGQYINDEAFKMATTDALSVACKSLGMGADVYWDKDNTKYNDTKKDNFAGEQEIENSKTETITPLQGKTLQGVLKGQDVTKFFEDYGITKLSELTKEQYAKAAKEIEQGKYAQPN